MRSRWSLVSRVALAAGLACGERSQPDATSLLDGPEMGEPFEALEQRGPVCSACLLGGGESHDFDGGSDTICPDLIREEWVSELDVQAAGWDTTAFRQRIERSFESELRWTDLTSTTAFPRSTAISGFQQETWLRATVALDGAWQRSGLDPAACVDGVCALGERVEDCSAWRDAGFFSRVSVALQTQDGALDASLSGRVWLRPPPLPAEASWQSQVAFVASTDIADVEGALRVEPLLDAPYGQLRLAVAYFETGVRGRLSVDFTNAARAGSGQALISETPLMAKFPADACSHDVVPTPLGSPHSLLAQRTPGELLEELRAAVGAADGAGRWLQTGRNARVDVELGAPEYACVGTWPASDGVAAQITNVPVRLRTSDGQLDWSEDAIYRFSPGAGPLTHQLALDRVYVPTSPTLSAVLGAFTFPPGATWRSVRLRGNYPAAGEPMQAAGLVLHVTATADCPGNDLPCIEAYQAAFVDQCLVAPASADCVVSPTRVDWTLPDPF